MQKQIRSFRCLSLNTHLPIYLLHSITSILIYEEEGPVAHELDGLKFDKVVVFFLVKRKFQKSENAI